MFSQSLIHILYSDTSLCFGTDLVSKPHSRPPVGRPVAGADEQPDAADAAADRAAHRRADADLRADGGDLMGPALAKVAKNSELLLKC